MQKSKIKKLTQSSDNRDIYHKFFYLKNIYLLITYFIASPCFALHNCPPSNSKLLINSSSFKTQLNPEEKKLPKVIKALLIAYSDSIQSNVVQDASQGTLNFKNGQKHSWYLSNMHLDLDSWRKLSEREQAKLWKDLGFESFEQVLDEATLNEQFLQVYPTQKQLPKNLPKNFEPGRLRDELFFRKLYGNTKTHVAQSLTTIRWGKQKLKVTRLHQIDQRLKAIYTDLKRCLPGRYKRYYEPSAGAFHWRTIKGTSRLSVHSFGAAIDIGVKYSNYWKWTLKVHGSDQRGMIPYKNNFPQEIIEIFQRYGFIWGGWWYHHDTMHFEYRPELLVDIK